MTDGMPGSRRGGRWWQFFDGISDACCGEVLFWVLLGLVALIAAVIAHLRN